MNKKTKEIKALTAKYLSALAQYDATPDRDERLKSIFLKLVVSTKLNLDKAKKAK